MAIQDDFSIDVVDRKITFTTAFSNNRPPSIYTVNELYSYLQDTFDEPGFMQYSVPMSAQTPTQYTMINGWFIDDESIKVLYGGSIQTSGWLYNSSPPLGPDGVTQIRWTNSSVDPPISSDIGVTLTGGTSTATGTLLAINTTRQVAWVRNTSANQFQNGETITGTGVSLIAETNNGVQNGETIWANLFSVGSKSVTTEAYVGQEDDYMGGRAYHGADAEARSRRKIEKIAEWWDVDVDFASGSPNLLGGTDHIDILIKVQEAGALIDGGRLFVGARQFGTVYSSFEFVATVAGNFVVPFASTGADLNSADGPYTVNFDGRTGTAMAVGDILENNAHGLGTNEPLGRLRAIVTSVTGGSSTTGSFEYYLIGENEPSDSTLVQFADNDDVGTRGSTNDFDINGTPTQVTNGPAQSQGVTITFGNAQADINEDSINEEYACTINCNNVALSEVYKHVQFLTCRGNQDGTIAGTQDTLLPSAVVGVDETSEFYRAVGDITVPWDTKTGTPPSEGSFVTNAASSWTASGVVVALSGSTGSSGQLTLTQVKGTWSNNDVVATPTNHGINQVTINGTPTTITDNTGAPFGTFAGGRWFVAQGVLLTNVPVADANNYQLIDLPGNVVIPPTQRIITFAGLVANDRAFLAEVDTASGVDITKNQSTYSSGGAVSDTSFVTGESIQLDVPTFGWVRHVDASSTTGEEFRYEYSSYVSGATSTVTLRPVAGGTDAGSSNATTINITGIATSYGSDGSPKTGMLVRETTGGEYAVVLRKIDNDNIETSPLSSGGTWAGKTVEFNQVVVAMAASDTYYWPFIDDEAQGSTLTSTVKYVSDTNLIGRMRFSDPDVGGTRILPFEQTGITLTDANLTVTAIRTTDSIAS